MAETLTANLALNINDFTNALQQASDKIAAFAQNVQQQIQGVNAAFVGMASPLRQLMQLNEQLSQSAARASQSMTQQVQLRTQMSAQMNEIVRGELNTVLKAGADLLANERAVAQESLRIRQISEDQKRAIRRSAQDENIHERRSAKLAALDAENAEQRMTIMQNAEDRILQTRRQAEDQNVAITRSASEEIKKIQAEQNALRTLDNRQAQIFAAEQKALEREITEEKQKAYRRIADEQKSYNAAINREAKAFADEQKALARLESEEKIKSLNRVKEFQKQSGAESSLLKVDDYQKAAQESIASVRNATQEISRLIKSGSASDSAEVQKYATTAKQAHTDALVNILRAQSEVNTALRNGNTSTVASAQELKVGIQQTSADATRAIREFSKALTETHEPISRMGDFLNRALSYASGHLFAQFVTGIVNTIRDFITESAQFAIKMESIKAAFSAVAGGAAGAGDTLRFLRSEAQRIGVDFLPLTESFKGFAAAIRGTLLEGEKGRQVFTAFTEAGRVLGLSGDQTKHIFIALEQMMNKGKVSAEELRRQMSNFLPGAFEIAARAIGVATSELDKMLKSGELISEVFIPAFARQVKQELGPGLEQAMNTAAASFARLGNAIKDISIRIGEDVLMALKPAADFLNALYERSERFRRDQEKQKTQKSAMDYINEGGIDTTKLDESQLKRITALYEGSQTGLLTEPLLGSLVSSPLKLAQAVLSSLETRKKLNKDLLDLEMTSLATQQKKNEAKDKEDDVTKKITLSQEQLEFSTKKTRDLVEEMTALAAKMRATSGPGAGVEIVPGQFKDSLISAATRAGIDPNLFARLVQRESGFDPGALNQRSGATGLTQIIPEYGEKPGFGVSPISRKMITDPAENLRYGAEYLAAMFKRYKDTADQVSLGLAAYNLGPGNIDDLLGQAKTRGLPQNFQGISMLPGMPKETRDYVPAILGKGLDTRGLTGDVREAALKDFVEKAEELQKTLTLFPAIYDNMDAKQKKVIDNLFAQAQQTKNILEEEKKRPQEVEKELQRLRQREQEKERENKQTIDMLEQMEARASDDRIAILEAEFAKKRRLMVDNARSEEDLKRFDVAATAIIEDEKKKLAQERFDAVAAIQKKFLKEFEQINDFLDKEEAKSSGKRVDTVRNEYEKRLEFLKTYAATVADQESDTYKHIQETIERLESVEKKRIQEAARRDLKEELAKQQKEYDRFAKGVESALSNAFESILTGAKNIGEAVKSFFIKLLADLAAKAAAGIVIPIIAKIFGVGGGAPGTSAAGGLGSLLGIFGGGGGSGVGASGGGGGSDVLSQGIGLLQQGNTISGALGGPSLGLGSLGGSTGIIGQIASTPIASFFGTGTTVATTEGLIGPTTASGSFFSSGTAGLGANVGDIFSGVGTGIGVGMILSQINKLLGITGAAGSTLAGAGGGAAGGAIIGSAIAPGIGTAIGAAIGTLVGALGGYLSSLFGGGKSRLFDPRGVTAGQVGYDETLGLRLTSPFVTEDIGYRRLGLGRNAATGEQQTGRTIANKMDEAINTMFTEFLKGFSALPPAFQKHLVNPLNEIALQIEAVIEKARFEGDDWAKQLETFLGTELPKAFEDLTKPLQSALQKMDPVIKKFTQVVETIGKDILEFEKAKTAMRNQIGQSMVAIQTALYSPAQSFLYAQEQLKAMQARFNAGTAQERIALAPRIGEAAAQLLNLAKNPEVLGQDPQAVRNLQTQLLEQLKEVQNGTDQAYTSFQEALGTQVDLAKQQLDVLVASLSNLGSVDSAVTESLAVLNQINNAIGGPIDSSGNDAQTRAQVALLGGLNTIAEAQLQELQNISAKLGSLPQFAEGTPFVQANTLAFLHAGEAVLPSALAQQYRNQSMYSEDMALVAHNTYAWMHGGGMRGQAVRDDAGDSQRLDVNITAEGHTPSIDAVLDKLVQRIIPEINKQVGRLDRELLISRRGR